MGANEYINNLLRQYSPKKTLLTTHSQIDPGWVTAKKTINLGSVFGSTIYAKGITKSSVIEDQERFYARWSKSDAYRQM